MSELGICRVDSVVTNTKAKLCCICRRSLRKGYRGPIISVIAENGFGQQAGRHACKACVRKFIKRKIIDIKDRIEGIPVYRQMLQKQLKQYEGMKF